MALPPVEDFPTGKRISRRVDDVGNLTEELHGYPGLRIVLTRHFSAGKLQSESYWVKREPVPRAAYEQERKAYPDMPAASTVVEDSMRSLDERGAARRRRELERRLHKPDPVEGERMDFRSRSCIEQGRRADALTWVAHDRHALGGMDRAQGEAFLQRLAALGCTAMTVCLLESAEDRDEEDEEDEEDEADEELEALLAEQDEEDPYDELSGYLVVELPTSREARDAVLAIQDEVARKRIGHGDFDDGQRLATFSFFHPW